ncbi:Ig-like domain-containing protein, partial [Sulfurimonas sp.]
MKKLLFSIFLGLSLLFSGCGNDYNNPIVQASDAGAYIVFDSANSDIPYPNNILFADSNDSTLNLPVDPTASDAAVKSALNTLDGFSTTSPITVSFNGEINASTLISGLKVYEISAVVLPSTNGVPYTTSIDANLTYGVDYVTAISGNKIAILPIKPLKPNQNYMVVLTKNITDNAGTPIAPDVASELLLQTTPLIDATGNHTALPVGDAIKLEGIRVLTQAMIDLAISQRSMLRENIVAAWSFKTQTIGSVATALTANNPTATMGVVDTNLTSKDIIASTGADVSAMSGNAEVYAGTLSGLPYYLATAASQYDTAPLTQSFEFNSTTTYMPNIKASLTIPVLVTVPKNLTMPTNGWPVVIFQHG